MQELKPCPFCGGRAVLSERFQAAKIWCNDCEIHTNPYPGKLSAIAAWNKRPEEPEASEGIFHRKLMIDDGRVYWLYPDGSHRALNKADVYVLNRLRCADELKLPNPTDIEDQEGA